MADFADVLIIGTSLGLGLGYALDFVGFESAVVWLAVYAVLMLVDIKVQMEGDDNE